MDRIIHPLEDDWSKVIDPSAAIARWEEKTGCRLPNDYRSFMIRYNGGRIYPLIFDCRIDDEYAARGEPETFLDPFYDWDYVERIRAGEFGGLPPGMLAIGSNPGTIEVLISLEQATYGQIVLWHRSHAAWGTDGNDTVWPQATSFRAFVDSLYEDEDNNGHEYWYLPGKQALDRKVEF